MKSEAKIVILVPTESEIGVFRRMMPRADVRLTGVGPYRCAAVTAAVCADRPDWMVLAGLAGAWYALEALAAKRRMMQGVQ